MAARSAPGGGRGGDEALAASRRWRSGCACSRRAVLLLFLLLLLLLLPFLLGTGTLAKSLELVDGGVHCAGGGRAGAGVPPL